MTIKIIYIINKSSTVGKIIMLVDVIIIIIVIILNKTIENTIST